MRLYNTLSGTTEDFAPIRKGEVKLYSCGPTVYDYAHIGNMRSYVFSDLVRRSLEYTGHDVTQVVNITDIGHLTSDADSGDDKMVKGLKRENLPLTLEGLKKLADKYEAAFKEDLKKLNIETPHHFPRATEYLKQEIELVEAIEKNGYAYRLDDGVYFDTGKLADYGKLGGLTPIDEAQARVGTGGKKSPRDFVLWKFSKDDKLGFESPFGRGFPGWHIECSAMSRSLLGQPFDIHTGGIDHIPVHHNNEIAQSEAAFGTKLANYWLHNEFVTVSDDKMAKSVGNFITVNTLIEKGFSPLAYRYMLLMSHYRSPANFTWEALGAAQTAYRRLKESFAELPKNTLFSRGKVVKTYREKFETAIRNDVNTPEAIAVIWSLIGDESVMPKDKRATLLDFDLVLGLNLDSNISKAKDIDAAREKKNYGMSDKLRAMYEAKGLIVKNTKSGTIVIGI